jgi:alkylation response protein AidB-like acyl-CoA dehydrogenase
MESDRHNEAYRAVIKRMGSDGKLGVGWPKEYGGLGFGPVEQQIFINEANRADVPLPLVTLQTVGPTLQAYGTEAQKKKFLPGILAGDIHFAIGYSEPEAGTDLASLRTSAVRGDEYIVNGQKMWTTGARRRLHLAGLPHRSECGQAQGHLDPDRRHQGSGLLLDPDHPVRRRAPHQRLVLQRRPGSADMLVGERTAAGS